MGSPPTLVSYRPTMFPSFKLCREDRFPGRLTTPLGSAKGSLESIRSNASEQPPQHPPSHCVHIVRHTNIERKYVVLGQ